MYRRLHFYYRCTGFFAKVLWWLWSADLLIDRTRSAIALDRAEIYDPLYVAKREACLKGQRI
ncbi:MAG: hypothetical protein LBT31_08755 [Synergistaceae bacterium]|jgi:hypothetical protein|nr:hypothetical protein [Synergistaceae bacterium]